MLANTKGLITLADNVVGKIDKIPEESRFYKYIEEMTELFKCFNADKFEEFCDADEDTYYSEKPAKAYNYKFDTTELRNAIDAGSKKTKLLDLVLTHLPKGLAKDFENLSKQQEYDMYKEWDL